MERSTRTRKDDELRLSPFCLCQAKIPKHKDTDSSSGTEAVLSTESESTNTSSDNDLVRRGALLLLAATSRCTPS
jgi:hypothetical protein